jgi:retron-type reverse transcriptase
VYEVPKRSGVGVRVIAQPAREVKRIQYWVLAKILKKYPIHSAATGYIEGRGIFDNAAAHSRNPYILKLDFADFFPSIKGTDFVSFAQTADVPLPEEDIDMLVRILFWQPKGKQNLQLSIGAPTSPFLSNAVMIEFDRRVEQFCRQNDVVYTRYADDMTFSMHDKNLRATAEGAVKTISRGLQYPKLVINDRKTIFGSMAQRRTVTGLVLANDGSVSLGRGRKRKLRAQIDHFLKGDLPEEVLSRLSGMLAFANSVEPDFLERLRRKYGAEIVSRIAAAAAQVLQARTE